jgi:hypothetical protein
MLARYLTVLKPDDRYGWDLNPATRWSDARQQAIDDAVMRESDQHFVDDLVVVHRTADRRDGGVGRPLTYEMVAVESEKLYGARPACHRRHMIDVGFRHHGPERSLDVQGLKLGLQVLRPSLNILRVVCHGFPLDVCFTL